MNDKVGPDTELSVKAEPAQWNLTASLWTRDHTKPDSPGVIKPIAAVTMMVTPVVSFMNCSLPEVGTIDWVDILGNYHGRCPLTTGSHKQSVYL